MANPQYGQNKFDDQADRQLGEIVQIKPSSDDTIASPTKTLTASDCGNIYICNISANTAAFVLPDALAAKGGIFTFFLDINSEAEASKDLMVASAATSSFIMGCGLDAGAVHDTTDADDQIIFDTSAGNGNAGDMLRIVSDGLHWYILSARALAANAFVSGTATRS